MLPHSEAARTLVTGRDQGVLSTADAEDGTPYGSVVEYAALEDGRILFFISDMAEHTTNLRQDASASLLVAEGLGDSMVLSKERVTLMGTIEQTESGDEFRERYLETHPHAAGYIDFDDFHFFTMEIDRVRYIGGFGRMSWIPVKEYLEAEPDPLMPYREEIIEHMNEDHADALLSMVRNLEGEEWAEQVVMTGVDRLGFDVTAMGPDEETQQADDSDSEEASASRQESVRFSFDKPAETPGDVRTRMVEMTEASRN